MEKRKKNQITWNKNQNKQKKIYKKPKESNVSHRLTCNTWAMRVMPACWGVLILFLTPSCLNVHQAHYEMNLQDFKQRNLLTGIQCLWFLWFGGNKHLPCAAAQCCPQSTTPDSQSIVRPGVSPWTCLEDDNIWQWWPGTNKYTFGANSYQSLTEYSNNVKDSKTRECCSLLNFEITKKTGISWFESLCLCNIEVLPFPIKIKK